jgi:peptidoglycan/xylan/chitin deacetylase (PgdA/CDA1 family)
VDARTRDLGLESTFEYGARVGAWRVLRLLDDYGVTATIYACGRALERNPVIAREFAARGHEPAAHGYRWVDHFRMTPDVEREQIRKAVDAIRETTGERPVGWYSRYARSPSTRALLVEEGGFLYDPDSYADEIPYWVRVDGRPHLVIPYQLDRPARPHHRPAGSRHRARALPRALSRDPEHLVRAAGGHRPVVARAVSGLLAHVESCRDHRRGRALRRVHLGEHGRPEVLRTRARVRGRRLQHEVFPQPSPHDL